MDKKAAYLEVLGSPYVAVRLLLRLSPAPVDVCERNRPGMLRFLTLPSLEEEEEEENAVGLSLVDSESLRDRLCFGAES